MVIDCKGKVIAVTGAGSGLGKAIALVFADCGASVAVMDGCECCVNATVEAIKAQGGIAQGFVTDVTCQDCVNAAFAKVEEAFGGVDALVNAKGAEDKLENRKEITEYCGKLWDEEVSVAMGGVFHATKAVVPYLVKRGGGAIVNVADASGMVAAANQGAFVAANAGIVQFSKAMAIELGPKNIRVNALGAGLTDDCGNRSEETRAAMLSHIPMHRTGTNEEIANTAVFLCSDMGTYVTGVLMNVDGGWACGYGRDF